MALKKRAPLSTWIALICGIGLLLASWLLYVHIRVYKDITYEPLCDLSAGLSCSAVAASRWHVFAGLPVALWGIVGYIILGLAALVDGRRGSKPGYSGVMCVLAWSFAAISAGLAYVSVTRIESVCLLCFGTYLVSGGLVALATMNARRRGRLIEVWLGELRAFFSPIWEGAFTLLVVASAIAALWTSYPRYWRVAAWLDDQSLFAGVDEKGDPWLGDPDAGTVIHEYFDFECPHCRTAHVKLRGRLEGKEGVRLVKHDMSRGDCHEDLENRPEWDGCGVMRGAHCAARQGKYWQFNDAVLSHPKPLKREGRAAYERRIAEKIGLDMEAFGACFESPDTVAAVKGKNQSARQHKVRATPAYFLGEKKMSLKEIYEALSGSGH